MNGSYKGIVFEDYRDLSLLAFNIYDNRIHTDEDYIVKVLVFIELVGHLRPRFVVFDKSIRDFEISAAIWGYSQRYVVAELFSFGIEKLFFIVTQERLEVYQNRLPENIHAFLNFTQLKNYILQLPGIVL
jgi:hypothetical protein